ncbi:MAG: hypothetical protein HKN05_04805 [Rhizobiales bacterium]|nr:hypothetical protein [Hyphomicrobiales bacterium]
MQPDGPETDQPEALRRDVNTRVILLTAFSLAIVGAYAWLHPSEIALAMFSMLATCAALGTAFVAVILSHRVFASQLNVWDKVLMLSFTALIAGGLVDGDAVTAFIEANTPAAIGTTSSADNLGGKL